MLINLRIFNICIKFEQIEKNMDITIFGAGYVGLVTGACFSQMGNNVQCVDIDEEKIDQLNLGNLPFYESGLEKIINNYAQNINFIYS